MDNASDTENSFGSNWLMAPAAPTSLAQLEEAHSTIIQGLAEFDRIETLAIVGGLFTFPGFHANTIRLELLQSFIHRNAVGRNRPTRNRIAQWLNHSLEKGWAAEMEDPVEDVFISNVVTNVGNSRIFEGVWESNDFWLQEALDALNVFCNEPWASKLFEQCIAVLLLSEALASRCKLPRYCMGGGKIREHLILPAQGELYARAASVRFSRCDLDRSGVSIDLLSPFIHEETPTEGVMGESTLEKRPLVRDGDGVLVALPSAISPAVRLHIAKAVVQAGVIEIFEQVLFSRQATALFDQGVPLLGGEIVESPELPPLPENSPAIVQELVKFDSGKFAHVLFFGDSMTEFLKTGLCGIRDINGKSEGSLLLHCQRCAEQVAAQPGYSGGLTIIILGGLGRACVFAGGGLPNRWHLTGFHLPDFLALGRVADTDLLRLWKLKQQIDDLDVRGVRFVNINGELNLLGHWKSYGERLIPRVTPGTNASIYLGTDFIAPVRRDLRVRHDLHAVERRNPDIWVPVRRFNVNPFLKKLELDSIYADEQAATKGRLRGIVETPRHAWWVSSLHRQKGKHQRDTQFRIWDAVLQWMSKIAPIAEAEFPELRRGTIEIFLRFEGLENWATVSLDDLPETEEVDVYVDRRLGGIQISIPLGFLRYFATPKNIGERKLIRACFVGISALYGNRSSPDALDDLVQRVVRNDSARFFHIAFAQDYRQCVGPGDVEPRFPSDGEFNFEQIGLAQRILGNADAKSLEGATECNRFLHLIVDDCWARLQAALNGLDRHSVIQRALENIEALECEKRRWAMTASALLSIHEDRKEVVDAAQDRESDRAGADLASRIIIEMAVCTSPLAGGTPISEADFDRLLALVLILLKSARASDAIKYSLTPARVQIYPNGEFDVDETYSETILNPYMKEQFTEEFSSAAAHYGDYFLDPAESATGVDAIPFPTEFAEAFRAEYGLSPQDLISAQIAIEKDALRDNRLVVQRSHRQIRELFACSGLSSDVPDSLFQHFSLWPRGDWEVAPEGFTNKDWYPWRYRRRISLVARPFIRLGQDEDASILFAPGVVNASYGLLIDRLLHGHLPSEDFHSFQMRSFVGEATRRCGNEFEEAVAEELRAIGLNALVGKPMTEFGADQSYGDLDVLAWPPNASVFYLIECKRLRFASTVAEVGEQLREFKGKEMDDLGRHVRRCQWLEQHHDALCRVAKTKSAKIQLRPLLVTSTVVPMQFSRDLPLSPDCIVSMSRLQTWVKAREH